MPLIISKKLLSRSLTERNIWALGSTKHSRAKNNRS